MKLAIISHTRHYKSSDGNIVGWGPTITEINHLAKDFDEIYHIAFLHDGEPPKSSLPYTSNKIKFISLKPVGGKTIGAKLSILANIPRIVAQVKKTLKKVDVFQLRTPTGIGVFLIRYLTLFCSKKGWYKYAGNWNQANPPFGYALQSWMLKKQKRIVTINGSWPKQPNHCLTFENPCLTETDRAEGLQFINSKSFEPAFTFCFVGRLEDAKGVQRIIDAFRMLPSMENIETIHFIGNGEKMDYYNKQCNELNLPVVFHGFLNREEVFKIYKKSHFILLPSDSEGFPKVIAEAMNYGCIPIVSDVSSIGQYVNTTNGYIIYPVTSDSLKKLIRHVINETEDDLKKKALQCQIDTANFTYDHYTNRIQNDIFELIDKA